MKISVIGTGYVGLVTGACFAEYGNEVHCIDIDQDKIRKLKEGKIPIYEPGLEEIVRHNLKRQILHFSANLLEALSQSKIIFLALGTPDDGEGNADLSGIMELAEEIGKNLNGYRIIVTKSTVPVGSADKIRKRISKHTKEEFDLVSNPEFLREGHAVMDFMQPGRIVVGVDTQKAKEIMEQLYYPFTKMNTPIFFMSTRSAELLKYACNSFLAMKISFANEMAKLCDTLGANYADIRLGLGSDKRIGEQFLSAGIGYGGSCFPKDVRALAKSARENQSRVPLLEEIESINHRQKLYILELLQRHFQTDDFNSYTFAIWGLSFKPNTDDIREAPSIEIIQRLLKAGASVRVHDPAALERVRDFFGDRIEYAKMYTALEGANALLILTEWPLYQEADLEKMKKLLKQALIFDGRNIYKPSLVKGLGFTYYGIGVNTSKSV